MHDASRSECLMLSVCIESVLAKAYEYHFLYDTNYDISQTLFPW